MKPKCHNDIDSIFDVNFKYTVNVMSMSFLDALLLINREVHDHTLCA